MVTVQFKTALLNELRKYIPDVRDRSTSKTETITLEKSGNKLVLANPSLCFIESVEVDNVNQVLLRDYYFNFGSTTKPAEIFFYDDLPAASVIVIKYSVGENWIYTSLPMHNAKMPRIGLVLVNGGGIEPAGVYDAQHFMKPVFRVALWIKSGESFVVNSEKISGDKLIDYLSEEVIKAVIDIRNACSIHNLITLDVRDGHDGVFDLENNVQKKNLTLFAWYQFNYASGENR